MIGSIHLRELVVMDLVADLGKDWTLHLCYPYYQCSLSSGVWLDRESSERSGLRCSVEVY